MVAALISALKIMVQGLKNEVSRNMNKCHRDKRFKLRFIDHRRSHMGSCKPCCLKTG